MQIVKFGSRSVAIGLDWSTELGDNAKSAAKAAIERMGAGVYAVYFESDGGAVFVGQAGKETAKAAKVPSGAAWLALERPAGAAHGVLVERVGEDFWVVAVGHRQIIDETDVVLGARAAAERVELLMSRYPGIEVTFAPGCEPVLAEGSFGELGVGPDRPESGSMADFVEAGIPPKEAFARQVVGIPKAVGLAVIALGALVIGGGLLFAFVEYERRLAEEEARLKAAAAAEAEKTEMEMERERRIAAAVRKAVQDATKKADPLAAVEECRAVVDRLGAQTMFGWRLERVECNDKNRAELSFRLQGIMDGGIGDVASFAEMRRWLESVGYRTTGSVGGRGEDGKLTVQIALPDRPGLADKSALPEIDAFLEGWYAAMQRQFSGLVSEVSWDPPKPKSVMYKDPELEKSVAARRNPARAMKPVPTERTFRVGRVRVQLREGFVLSIMDPSLLERPWLWVSRLRIDQRQEGEVTGLLEFEYAVQ
jgi:hypothetical protein